MDVVMAGPLLSSAQIGADVFSPSFSNGRVLLFHAGRDRAALMRVSFERDGRPEITTVLRDGAANYHAVPSPDGRSLAFDSDRDGTRAVYVAGRDAAGARRISGEGYAAVPRWSPDSRKLAFIRADPARPRVWNVWVANVASGALQQVSRHRAGQAWGASWFPDGHRLAYSVEDSLIVSDLRDGTVRVTRSPRPGRLVRTPAVSPDGKWIVFQAYRDGVWLLEVSTGRTRRVLSDPSAEEFAWSPDGTRIVYHTRRGGAWSLWQLSFTQDEARAL
jgi:Tol biopolymer transport system component